MPIGKLFYFVPKTSTTQVPLNGPAIQEQECVFSACAGTTLTTFEQKIFMIYFIMMVYLIDLKVKLLWQLQQVIMVLLLVQTVKLLLLLSLINL
jgi:hypothetical protein